ncbi:fasciclin-like arabinogalactan protein 2 [Tasmannia lanceolata]|uniref:fasciclin-like arabinogalactan protein 2 n=1 Tax=Tasmannia lanceolata TaxID=3420 RepID=UPI004063D9FA
MQFSPTPLIFLLSFILLSYTPNAHNSTKNPEFSTFNHNLTIALKKVQINLTTLMAKQCKVFADLLTVSGALQTFNDNVDGGLTVFCPMDEAMKSFMPKYKNLTAEGKESLLLYHGVPVYESMTMLRSSNGLMNTLATDGAKKFDFTVQNEGEEVTLETKVITAKITGTLLDEQPLGIYTVDKVLQPIELFKALIPVVAPAPAPVLASAPKKAESSKAGDLPSSPSIPSEPEISPDDQSGSVRFPGGMVISVMVSLGVWFLM